MVEADETVEALGLKDKILISIDNGGRDRTDEYHYFRRELLLAKSLESF